ncbi:Cytochrome P450 82A3, partial [Mucuna pruriens]
MELVLNCLNVTAIGLLSLILLSLFLYNPFKFVQGKEAPTVAGAWPILGHLPLLSASQSPHRIFGALADKYGPIFSIKLGVKKALVINNWEVAKECFTTNDVVVSSRPRLVAVELMGYDHALLVFAPYGPYWRQLRKIITSEILSSRRVEQLQHVFVSEVQTSIKELYNVWCSKKNESGYASVDLKQWFSHLTFNIVLRMVIGKRYFSATTVDDEKAQRCVKAVKEFMRLLGVFTVGDAIPYLRWFDFGGHEKAMKETAKELDENLGEWLEEHRQNRALEENVDGVKDFMDVMISLFDGKTIDGIDADTIIKSTVLAVIGGATDTTSTTLTWAICLILKNPPILKKVEEEFDIQVGKERCISEFDINKLIYFQAIVKETLRLYSPAPLSAPHEFTEDCTLSGYNVKKGTRLIMNLWKIHTDLNIWIDPLEFKPERFLTTHKDIDMRGHNFELLPFGCGRRICPGISFALQVIHLTLASVLHSFEILNPSTEPIDMTETFGITNTKTTPLDILIKPPKMEFLLNCLNLNLNTITITFISLILCLFLYRFSKSSRTREAPLVEGSWPILGHLKLLNGSQTPHKTLGALADKYGPLFTIKLGVKPALVLSNWEMAKELFTKNDIAVSSRPKLVATEVMSYNQAFVGLAPYGPYWRELRKIVTVEFLSNRRIDQLSHIRVSEIQTSIKELFNVCCNKKNESNYTLVDMTQWLAHLTFNMVVRMVVGKRYFGVIHVEGQDKAQRFMKNIREFMRLMGTFTVADGIPCLRWLDLGGYEKAMKATANEIDKLLSEWLDEHRQNQKVERERDFMDVMISTINGAQIEGFDADTICKATTLELILGGTDTTAVTLTWAISLLLQNPLVLEKAKEEIDMQIGKDGLISESDISKLVYLHAIVKETLRLYPPAPLSSPREFTENCILGDYYVKKGTRLIPNLWKIHRDPSVWSDPLKFKPERFLNTHKNIDVKGQNYELLPFGSGRRICAGMSLGLYMVHFTLANFLQSFDILSPTAAPIDMAEIFQFTNTKATTLEIL